MIRITRKDYNDIPEPLTIPGTYRQIERAVAAMNGDHYNTNYYKDEVVVKKLKAFSVHKDNLDPGDRPKCYYCESYVDHVASLQVEHFRPKAKVDNIDNNNLSHSGYYWLVWNGATFYYLAQAVMVKMQKAIDFLLLILTKEAEQ